MHANFVDVATAADVRLPDLPAAAAEGIAPVPHIAKAADAAAAADVPGASHAAATLDVLDVADASETTSAAEGMTRREAVALIVGPALLAPVLAGCAARTGNGTGSGEPPQAVTKATVKARAATGVDLRLPLKHGSVRMLVIGDSGTGGRAQQEVADQIVTYREAFPFDFAIMLGDNMYGRQRPADFVRKFERPYKTLLDANVTFHAALGNHDDPKQRHYAPFNMQGERYYTFSKGHVRFFAMDSTLMDRSQVAWLKRELEKASEDWKICYAHHPLYSSGARHGSEMALRRALEPLFVEHGVSTVLAGHDHFYERIKPQQEIQYFVCGGSAKLRTGNIRSTPMKAVGFDRDRSFMLVEIADDDLFFQAISRTGETVDHGTVPRVKRQARAADLALVVV